MSHLIKLTDAERSEHLRRAIRRRSRYHKSDEQLERILSRLNTRKPYVLKITDRPKKFLNIITAERIATEKNRAMSEIIPIYGNFRPGYFERLCPSPPHAGDGYIDESTDAAAVKISLFQRGTESAFVTYTLALYEIPFSENASGQR